MMKTFLFITVLLFSACLKAQEELRPVNQDTVPFIEGDSLNRVAEPVKNPDTIRKVMREHSPRQAAIRSAILPGLGQIYNKKYWKLPIVYGALGVSGGVFNYNLQWYRRTRFAYRVLIEDDTASFGKVHPDLQGYINRNDPNSLKSFRDEFRRQVDYSALIFILIWGLNVVDATVDAHLKSFDVSPDLSLKFKAGPSEMANTVGIGIVLAIK